MTLTSVFLIGVPGEIINYYVKNNFHQYFKALLKGAQYVKDVQYIKLILR